MSRTDPDSYAPGTRPARRIVAVACAVGILAFPLVAFAKAGNGGSEALLESWAVACALIVFGSFAVLQLALGDAPGKRTAALDEREREFRDQAYRVSYVVLTSISLGGASVAVGFGDGSSLEVGPGAMAILISFAALIGTLPTLTMAWMVPTPPDRHSSRDQANAALWAGASCLVFAASLAVDLGPAPVVVLLAATGVLGLMATRVARRQRL